MLNLKIKIKTMKNTILNRLYLLILCASIGGMFAFCIGGYTESEAVKFNALLGIGLAELIIIFSIGILFYIKNFKD